MTEQMGSNNLSGLGSPLAFTGKETYAAPRNPEGQRIFPFGIAPVLDESAKLDIINRAFEGFTQHPPQGIRHVRHSS